MASTPSSEPPILNITGEKVALGPHRRDLMPLYQRWINDFAVTRTMSHGFRPMTLEAEEAWYARISQAEHLIGFTVYELATLRPIGVSTLGGIDWRHRTAEFGVMIGEKELWGKGYGGETTRLMLDYGFGTLGLHHIMLRVVSCNERGIRAYTQAGFREIGRLREAWWIGDHVHDLVLMDCLASEHQSREK